jgi:hypothetical protein
VVCPCPLVVTEEFMSKHGIDLVVHGFANDADADRQNAFFELVSMKTLSTTDRIKNIQSLLYDEANEHKPSKPQKFRTALSTAVGSSQFIPFDPFPLNLRTKIAPHIPKPDNEERRRCVQYGRQPAIRSMTRFSLTFNQTLQEKPNFTSTRHHTICVNPCYTPLVYREISIHLLCIKRTDKNILFCSC